MRATQCMACMEFIEEDVDVCPTCNSRNLVKGEADLDKERDIGKIERDATIRELEDYKKEYHLLKKENLKLHKAYAKLKDGLSMYALGASKDDLLDCIRKANEILK